MKKVFVLIADTHAISNNNCKITDINRLAAGALPEHPGKELPIPAGPAMLALGGGAGLPHVDEGAPDGLLGTAYWYGLYPFHQFIFSAMVDALARRAEAA